MQAEIDGLIVSRETMADLSKFHDLLMKWTPKINLISKYSTTDVWNRHIWDSAQIIPLQPEFTHWVDFGSGGGFPALVLAIFAKNNSGATSRFTMVESDRRKATFLRTVVRELSLNAEVLSERVEQLSPQNAQVVSARALTELDGLLTFADRHLAPGGTALFPKGESWQKEVHCAQNAWSFAFEAHKSKTNPAAAILEIKDIKRV